MTRKQNKRSTKEIKTLMSQEEDFLRPLMKVALQEVLEAEMEEALGAAKSECTSERQRYRSGYYQRKLITRVGTLELRVPQDRQERFSTEVFSRYQRSEKALVAALVDSRKRAAKLGSAACKRLPHGCSAASQITFSTAPSASP